MPHNRDPTMRCALIFVLLALCLVSADPLPNVSDDAAVAVSTAFANTSAPPTPSPDSGKQIALRNEALLGIGISATLSVAWVLIVLQARRSKMRRLHQIYGNTALSFVGTDARTSYR